MNTSEIIGQIDSQIVVLQHARAILLGSGATKTAGRPKKLGIAYAIGTTSAAAKPKRKMSAASKARIAAAQKARWAKAKKTVK